MRLKSRCVAEDGRPKGTDWVEDVVLINGAVCWRRGGIHRLGDALSGVVDG